MPYYGKFICFKMSRILLTSEADCKTPTLVIGSRDEPVNKVTVWTYTSALYSSEDVEDPTLVSSSIHEGDIMDIRWDPTYRHLFVAGSKGDITLNQMNAEKELVALARWADLFAAAACSGVRVRDSGVLAASGEDGRLLCLAVDEGVGEEAVIDSGHDCCAISDLEVVDQATLATVNTMGHLKVWDTRAGLKQPKRSITLTGDPLPLHCMRRHPGQPHIMATGGSPGFLYVWDLRQERFPVTQIATDDRPVWQLAFHPFEPQHLFAAAGDAVLRWSHPVPDQAWNFTMSDQKQLQMTSLLGEKTLGVSSIDISNHLLVAATDDDILYTMTSLCT